MGGGEGAAHEGLVAGWDVEGCAAAGDVEPSGRSSISILECEEKGDRGKGNTYL